MQATDSPREQLRETIGRKGEGDTPAVGVTQMPEPTEDSAGDKTQEEGKKERIVPPVKKY
jgi:hypothetical protein